MLLRTVSIHEQVAGGGGEELGPCLLEEVVPYRQFTAQEIELLGMLAGLQVSLAGRRRRWWIFLHFCLAIAKGNKEEMRSELSLPSWAV